MPTFLETAETMPELRQLVPAYVASPPSSRPSRSPFPRYNPYNQRKSVSNASTNEGEFGQSIIVKSYSYKTSLPTRNRLRCRSVPPQRTVSKPPCSSRSTEPREKRPKMRPKPSGKPRARLRPLLPRRSKPVIWEPILTPTADGVAWAGTSAAQFRHVFVAIIVSCCQHAGTALRLFRPTSSSHSGPMVSAVPSSSEYRCSTSAS